MRTNYQPPIYQSVYDRPASTDCLSESNSENATVLSLPSPLSFSTSHSPVGFQDRRPCSSMNSLTGVILSVQVACFRFNHSLDELIGDLGDDCVSEAFKSVHPIGYPISHSTHVGFSFPPTTSPRLCLPRSVAVSLCMNCLGVGHIAAATFKF